MKKVIEVRFSGGLWDAPVKVVLFQGTQKQCEQFLMSKYRPCMDCAGTDVYIA